jgi:HK97 gp10 family phage protein
MEVKDVPGLADVLKNLAALPGDLQTKILGKSAKAGAEKFAAEARRRAPVEVPDGVNGKTKRKPGTLRDSIYVFKKRKLKGDVVVGYRVSTGKDAFWADFLEFGFHHVKTGQTVMVPFMRPAFEAKKDGVVDDFAGDVRKAIDEMKGGRIR